MNTKTSTRLYYLDWMRVIAILTVFIYHSTRFFNLSDWHVKNLATYQSVEIFEKVVEVWMMPLIFVISGASLFYAMDMGGAGKFIKDKVLRLLVPLLVCIFTHATLQVYLERLTHHQFMGSYFQFLPHYFDGLYMDVQEGGNFAWHGMHLWYLLFLFLFSMLFLPLFRWLKGSGKGVLRGLGNFLGIPGMVYILALILILIEPIISGSFLDEIDPGGWSLGLYMGFFVLGFVIISHERLQDSIRRIRWLSLGLGVLSVAGYFYLVSNARHPVPISVKELWDDPLASLASWFLILAFIGLGMQHLDFSKPFLKYANEAVLPFYILHQTVLLSLGYFVVQWHIPSLAKWLVIFVGSFVTVMGLYELFVRRNNILRVLFGMKGLSQKAAVLAPEAQLEKAPRTA